MAIDQFRLPVAIIGAGFAGLTAAAHLRREGIPVVVYASEIDEEYSAPFITNRLAAALEIAAQTRPVERYGEAVLIDGVTYRYPLGLWRRPSFVASALGARAVALSAEHQARSAADVLRGRYGQAFSRTVAIPLLEHWSGTSATLLAPAVMDALHHVQHRSVGYVYPMGGVRLLHEKLAVGLDEAMQRGSPVERIHVEDGRAVAVEVGGRLEPAAAVVSALPVHALAHIVTGTNALAPLARFRYRAIVGVNLAFTGRELLPETMLWVPDKRPFFRLTEVSRSLPLLAPDGKTSITADLGCSVGDATWTEGDAALGERCLDALGDIVPGARERYLGCDVSRTPVAYPLSLREYEEDRKRFELSTGVDGLYSIGRNGAFAHLPMEDAYWRTIRQMRELTAAYTSLAAARSSIASPSDLNTVRLAEGNGFVPATSSPNSA